MAEKRKLSRNTSRGQVEYVRGNPGITIDLDGQEIFFRQPRERKPGSSAAVYIHGLGASSTNWNELQGFMEPDVYGTALDLPGFGRSGRAITGDYSPQAHSEVIANFIRHQLDGEPVHVFGNSMGGAVSLRLVSNHPELVKSVTYVSPALHNRLMATNVQIPLVTLPFLGEKVAHLSQRVSPERQVRDMYNRVFADSSRVHPQRREDAVADASIRHDVPFVTEALVGSARGLVSELLGRSDQKALKRLAQVKKPSLFIYGRHDSLVDSTGAFKVTKAVPQARVVVFPHSGHVAQMEDPDLVAMAWKEFIYPITDARNV